MCLKLQKLYELRVAEAKTDELITTSPSSIERSGRLMLISYAPSEVVV